MLNHIDIMGNMVADPTMRKTGNGISVCSFRIACARDNPSENGQKTDFVDCVAWRKTGEFVSNYFMKGKPILISGRLQMREWTDQEGKKRTSPEILVESAHFCGGDKVQKQAATADIPPMPTGEFTELGGGDNDFPWKDDVGGLPL